MIEVRYFMIRFLMFIGIISLLTACSSMSKEQCESADWKAYGYTDGAKGKETTNFNSYAQACGDYGIKSDFERYLVGHKQGVIVFCTFESGYQAGIKNYRYQGICKAHKESDFLSGLAKGKKLFTARQDLREAQNEVSQLRKAIDDKRRDQEINEDLIVDNGTTEDKRRLLIQENKQITRDIEVLDNTLHRAVIREDRLRSKVRKLEKNGPR
jgi:hypothetical protein